MLTLILFLLVSAPQEGGTVVLNTRVPEAEFYLDANFVAATDANGMLTVENLPAGSFTCSVVKRGYKTYKGSFSIRDGETKRLSPVMEKIRETRDPDMKAVGSSRESKPLVKKSQIPRNAERPADEVRQSPAQSSPANAPVAARTATQAASEESQAAWPLLALIVLFVIASAGAGLWIRTRKRAEAHIRHLETAAEIETPRNPTDAPNRPDPQFIEELRRREELLNAGFVGSNPRVVDKESMKEKEIVIVLPKEAFRYEEDK